MADKKKKLAPVTSHLKEDVDAAINEAAAEILAETITQKAVDAVMDRADETVSDTITNTLAVLEDTQAPVAEKVFGMRKLKPVKPNEHASGRLVLDDGNGELSTPHDAAKDALETYPLVSIYGVVLKPLAEKVTLGELIAYDSELSNWTRNVHRMVRYLPVDRKLNLHHFAFVLNGTTTHLYISEGSYVMDDKNDTYYYASNKGTLATAVILNSKLTNVLLEGGSTISGAIIEDSVLNDAVAVTLSKDELARNYILGNGGMYNRGREYVNFPNPDEQPSTVKESRLVRSDVVNSQINKVNATQSNITNTAVTNTKHTCLIDTTLGGSTIEGSFYFEARRSYLALSINATHRMEMNNVRVFNGHFYQIPHEVLVDSPFGLTKINWINDTKVRIMTSANGVVLEFPSESVESYSDRFLFIPYDEPSLPQSMMRGWQPPHVEQLITEHVRFFRNGKRLPRPDVIQQSFLSYLIDTVTSRLKILSLLEAVKHNRHTVAPGLNRGDHDDHLPF